MLRRTCSLTLVLCCLLGSAPLRAVDSNRVLLRVNDRIATLFDYEVRRNERLRAIQQADLEPTQRAELLEGIGAQILNNMLDELLVLSRADQIGFFPTDDEIAEAMNRAKQGFGIQTDEQFAQALAASGMSQAGFRQQIETNLRVSRVMANEVQQRVQLSEEDLRRFYHENERDFTTPARIRLQEMVVLDTAPLSPDERTALAADVVAALGGGETMGDLAARHSSGGNTSGLVALGWIEAGDLDAALEEAVWDLPIDGVSEPVAARGGLHVLQVLGREEAQLLPFTDVADDIDQRERGRLLQQEYEAYLVELREAAYIRISQLPEDIEGFNINDSASRMTVETAPLLIPEIDPQP